MNRYDWVQLQTDLEEASERSKLFKLVRAVFKKRGRYKYKPRGVPFKSR